MVIFSKLLGGHQSKCEAFLCLVPGAGSGNEPVQLNKSRKRLLLLPCLDISPRAPKLFSPMNTQYFNSLSMSRGLRRRCTCLPVTRNSFYSTSIATTQSLRSPTSSDAQALSALLDQGGSLLNGFAESPDDLSIYNVDWKDEYHGKSQIVARPKTAKEVSRILSYCNSERIGVVPQGGNTGLVGGSVPVADEVIISTEGMNTIYNLDTDSGILTCDAGCILQDVQTYASERSHLVPIDLGAKGTCQIGGNVATNAGGQYFYRFGSLHANVLGLEVVLADGTILDLLNTNRKDNTGYDMKHLFIGSEGTLGLITRINLSFPRLPLSRHTALLACDNFGDVLTTLALAKKELGEILAAFEFMDRPVLKLVQKEHRIPVAHTCSGESDGLYPFYILVETQGSNEEHDAEKMSTFLEKSMEGGQVVDGVLSQDLTQVEDMWSIREHCNPATKAAGYNWKYDISIPVSDYYDIAEEMRERINAHCPDALVVNWGHVIDGNLHLNVATPGIFEEDKELTNIIEPYLFESVVRRKGSISAEHGLGRCKNEYLGRLAKNEAALARMKMIKNMFDPNGILNPGKYLPTK